MKRSFASDMHNRSETTKRSLAVGRIFDMRPQAHPLRAVVLPKNGNERLVACYQLQVTFVYGFGLHGRLCPLLEA